MSTETNLQVSQEPLSFLNKKPMVKFLPQEDPEIDSEFTNECNLKIYKFNDIK